MSGFFWEHILICLFAFIVFRYSIYDKNVFSGLKCLMDNILWV